MWNTYVGLKYKDNGRTAEGLDCWGLVRLVYEQQYNIVLPNLSSEYQLNDKERIQDLVAQHKEGWLLQETPSVGSVVVFNILGSPTHVGIYIGNNNFLHIRRGSDSVIESLTNSKWKHRIHGYYKYDLEKIQLVGSPHPLKTKTLALYVTPGQTVRDVIPFIEDINVLKDKIETNLIIIFNSKILNKSEWDTTVINTGDLIQYRIVPKDEEVFRLAAAIALTYVAYQIAGPAAAALLPAGTSAAVTTAVTVAAATATVVVGSALINAIAPIRPPSEDTSKSRRDLTLDLFESTSNYETPWSPIPIPLGKIRYAAPVASKPYVSFDAVSTFVVDGERYNRNTNYIHGALCWGFAPLRVDNYKIGDSPVELHPEANIYHVTYHTYDPNFWIAREQQARDIYHTGREYIVKNVELTADFSAKSNSGTVPEVNNMEIGDWMEVAFTNINSEFELNIAYPQGKKLINKKDGKSTGYINRILIEWKPINSSTWNFYGWVDPFSYRDPFVFTIQPIINHTSSPIVIRLARAHWGNLASENSEYVYYSTSVLLSAVGKNYSIPYIVNPPAGTKLAHSVFKIPANKDFSGGLGAISAVVSTVVPFNTVKREPYINFGEGGESYGGSGA